MFPSLVFWIPQYPKTLTIISAKGNNDYYKHTIYKHVMFYTSLKACVQTLGAFFCAIILLSSFYRREVDCHSRKSMHFVVNQARTVTSDLLFNNWINLGKSFDLYETLFPSAKQNAM